MSPHPIPGCPRTALLLLAVLGSGLPAQFSSHQIPERGVAFYQRESKRETTVLEPTTPEMRNAHVHDIPQPPRFGLVLHSDLDRKAMAIERSPSSVFDLGEIVAYDLRTLGKRRFERVVTGIGQFGPLKLRGRLQKAADGRPEQLIVDVQPGPRGKGDRSAQGTLKGELRVTRSFDASKGLIDGFEWQFRGELGFPNRNNARQVKRARFQISEVWKLREVAGNRGAKFNTRVAEAIRAGSAHLKKQLANPAQKFSAAPDQGGHTKRSGELALILLTLLKSGESPSDPDVKRGLDELRRRKITDTYSLGVALLTLEACYTPSNERDDLLSGRITEPRIRKPGPEDRKIMQEWVDALLDNRTESNRDNLSRWHYLGGGGFDNSCSQYAVLGLYAAQLCGIEVDRKVWIGATKHFLREQGEPTDRVRFSMTRHRDIGKTNRGRGTATPTEPAGWTYTSRRGLQTGSMTTAGIGSLTICESVLSALRRRPREVSVTAIRAAVKSGFAWIAEHYDLRQNPGHGGGWRYYYLYGLERASELNQVAYLNGKDWYFDGATLLLEEQGKDGKWGGDIDTCFAVLFLKKAALPVVTGKR